MLSFGEIKIMEHMMLFIFWSFFFFKCTEYVYQMVLWITSIAFACRIIFSASSPWKDTFCNFHWITEAETINGIFSFHFDLLCATLLCSTLASSLTYVWKHRLMKWKIKSKQETLVCFVIKKTRKKMHYHFFQCS